MFKDPFIFKIQDAELFGTATTFENFNVQLDNSNKVTYWTENTILPSGTQYVYAGTTSGNIWHKIENHTYDNLIYGLEANQILSGDIHFCGKNLTLKNVVFTGGALSKCNDVYIDLYNVSPSGVIYCIGGECNNAYINLISGNYGTTSSSTTNVYLFQRGSNLNNVKTKINNIYFTCDKCTFNNNLFVGPNIRTKAADTDIIFETNDIFATLNSGQTTRNAQENSVWVGGYYSGQTDKTCATVNNINTVINGGKWLDSDDLKNAVGIFSGPAILHGIVTVNNCNLEMNGGDVSTLYSGGYVQQDGKLDILGDIKIIFNDGIIGHILAVETAASITSNTGYQHVSGNSYIYINGGTIKGIVNPGRRHVDVGDKEKIYGESYVILNGKSNYSCKFSGGYNDGSTIECNIIFENYTGSLSGATIKQFKDIQFTKNCSVDLSNTTITNNTDIWTFDISHRNISNADIPMITMTSGQNTTAIKLIIGETNTLSTYKLIDHIQFAEDISSEHEQDVCEIYYNNTLLASGILGTFISGNSIIISNSGTIFDGYGLSLINDQYLVFTKTN